MLFLNVPFNQKDEAKRLGANWDANEKKWYIRDGSDVNLFVKWIDTSNGIAKKKLKLAILQNKIEESKQRMKYKKKLILIELVPQTAWFSNLRSELTGEEWESVKEKTFKAAEYVCEICGGRGPKYPVECHESWQYDSKFGVQKLIKTVALCPACHEATHMGRANIKGRYEDARAHLMKVNGWDVNTADNYFDKAGDEWLKRNEIKWKLDARWLLSFVEVSEESKQKILDHANKLFLEKKKSSTSDVLERVRHLMDGVD